MWSICLTPQTSETVGINGTVGMTKSRLSSSPRTWTCWVVCSREPSVSPTLSFLTHLNGLLFFAYISGSLRASPTPVPWSTCHDFTCPTSSWRRTSTICFLEKSLLDGPRSCTPPLLFCNLILINWENLCNLILCKNFHTISHFIILNVLKIIVLM